MKTLKSKKTETGYIILNNQNEILYTFDMIVNDICDSKDDYSGMNWYKKTISKIKRIKNRYVFDQYQQKYNFIIVKEYNNIIEFNYNNKTYYYTEVNNKIREKSSKINLTIQNIIK